MAEHALRVAWHGGMRERQRRAAAHGPVTAWPRGGMDGVGLRLFVRGFREEAFASRTGGRLPARVLAAQLPPTYGSCCPAPLGRDGAMPGGVVTGVPVVPAVPAVPLALFDVVAPPAASACITPRA